MDHVAFNRIFSAAFAAPLIELGFSFVGRTKTLRYVSGTRDLRIIRVISKWPHPGEIRMVICFRHTFLQLVSSDDPDTERLIVQDFPRKLKFDDFDTWLRPAPIYRPENLGRWPVHTFVYKDKTEKQVTQSFQKLLTLVEQRILPWANSLTEEGELEQIQRYGEDVWCEKRWIEDYEAFLTR